MRTTAQAWRAGRDLLERLDKLDTDHARWPRRDSGGDDGQRLLLIQDAATEIAAWAGRARREVEQTRVHDSD